MDLSFDFIPLKNDTDTKTNFQWKFMMENVYSFSPFGSTRIIWHNFLMSSYGDDIRLFVKQNPQILLIFSSVLNPGKLEGLFQLTKKMS